MHRHRNAATERPLRPTGRRRRPEVAPHILALLHQAQQGDRDAFAALYLTYREPVTRYVTVRMRGRDRDLIADLVQEAFTGALADLSSALADVRGWLIWQAAKACNQHDWSRRRYVRAAYAVREHTDRASAAPVTAAPPTPPRLRRPGSGGCRSCTPWPGSPPTSGSRSSCATSTATPATPPPGSWAAAPNRYAAWNNAPCAACRSP